MQESTELNHLEKSTAEEAVPVVLNFDRSPKPISELVTEQDFPRCALGEFVDIGGFTGVVVDVIKQSLKVTSQEGDTLSYNANGLRKLYAPKMPQPTTTETAAPTSAEVPQAAPEVLPLPREETPPTVPKEEPAPKANVIEEPNFDRPTKPIIEFAGRSDFPQCTLGEFLNIGGYAGVVVEIVKQSLKVRSAEGTTMSFNANGLRKLYGPKVPAASHESEAMPIRSISLEAPPVEHVEAAPEPKKIVQLDFNQPIKVIRAFAGRRDFPECALGQYVDVRGFSGIVVRIVGDSLELQAEDGTLRSFGIEGLRKVFGR